jgi:hypothetical protein
MNKKDIQKQLDSKPIPSEVFGPGLYEQMEDVKANKECYNKLTLEMLTDFALELSKGKDFDVEDIKLPELDSKDIELYDIILDKIKSGYLYTFTGGMVITTGSSGAVDFINQAKESNTPPLQLYNDIFVSDLENNIEEWLINITWIKDE